ncbi:uncharacterized protein LOC129886885 [Solanum dulcamara]|uniref:uncharacterized protein LOC129886885 n=1 Tax=Solanum dulcamara TaxID=45834 RepID=UPI002484DFF5|nr:uncharacterized protein LOC129886885 [Solanum dulcamara]
MVKLLTLFLILSITTTADAAVNSTISITNTIDIISTAVHSRKHARNTTGTKYSISPHELDTLLSVLRYSGYPLFSNAIDTSDIQFQILTGHTTLVDASSAASAEKEEEATPPLFTIFAPRDHFLYTLDMASDADAYVAALRSHIIPSRRLTITELRNLTTPYLDTLLPHYSILVENSKSDDDFITVDGVRVSDPNLFVGSRFAVHGLDGILLTGFNMYEDTLSQMGKGFFAPEKVEPFAHKSGRHSSSASALPEAKNGGFSRVIRKHRKLQYRRIWKSNYSVRRSDGEDDF